MPDPERVTGYLDHAATTPVRPEAVAAMLPFFAERFANPSGAHAMARDARRAVDEYRELLARTLGTHPGNVVFCGNGSEADNLAILGVVEAEGGAGIGRGPAALCPASEHHAVTHPVEHVGGALVRVDATGAVDLDALAEALHPHVRVVSVMAVNNEVGTVTDLAAVAAVVRERAPEAVLHTDAVQAHCWIDTAELFTHVDALSLSAHKAGGPKGVGVLVVRPTVPLVPRLLGGGQERDRRSGTHDVAGIAGACTAWALAAAERAATVERVGALRDRLLDGLLDAVPDCVETVPRAAKVAGSAHLCIPGVESEALLYLLDEAGVYASAGSSCASGAVQLSHVLTAMGVRPELGTGALRLSLGPASVDADVDRALEAIPPAVARLRSHRAGATAARPALRSV